MKKLKTPLTIRGDNLYCPLPLAIDTYGNCLTNCHHCNFRRLNYVWGMDLKPLDVSILKRKLFNGLKNKTPKSSLAWAIKKKKTIRIGSRADPYQDADKEHKVTCQVIRLLIRLDWSFVVQTRHTELMFDRDFDLLKRARCVVLPVISPGWISDWEILERKRTTRPDKRIKHLIELKKSGVKIGVNGEPFIPGYHTVEEFKNLIRILSDAGIKSYNTYSFHWNEYTVKRLIAIDVDVEKIWHYNRDEQWRPILRELIAIAKKYDIILGSPDFVNNGNYTCNTNTCCGIDVPNPCTFNAITWKKMMANGESPDDILLKTWEGIGDQKMGEAVMNGTTKEFYTMKDIKE